MTKAINEACIGEEDFSGAVNAHLFAAGRNSFPIYGVFPKW